MDIAKMKDVEKEKLEIMSEIATLKI